MNGHDSKHLALGLDAYEPGCECNRPEDGEDGIIYSLACRLREFFDLAPTAKHAWRAKRAVRGEVWRG